MRGAVAVVCVLVAGCGGGSSPSTPSGSTSLPAGPLSFSVAPIDPALVQYIDPLGQMRPWAHTLPTDHIYFYHQLGLPAASRPIVVPASGTVTYVLTPDSSGEVKVGIRVNGTFLYYFDHINLAPGIGVGTLLQAGSALGTSSGIAFDFAVVNYGIRVGFVNPNRYGGGSSDTLSTDAPLKYFVEPIRSQFYAKVRRDGPDLDGRISYDLDGTLSGNWFAEDLPPSLSQGGDMSSGTRQLAFARDSWHPDRLRVSVGGLGMTGLYGVPPDTADFATVTPASGAVVYRLLNSGEPGGPPGVDQLGLLVVQMLDAQRMKVEAVPDRISRTAAFSANAQIYVR